MNFTENVAIIEMSWFLYSIDFEEIFFSFINYAR